jgi:hypothetical protein
MYPSRYSNGKTVSAAQYITELICEHKAKLDKIDLHYRFWTNSKWSRYYRDQIASANKLLTKYNPKAIIRALNDSKAEKIYSLRAPHLLPIIQQHEQDISAEELVQDNNIQISRPDKATFREIKQTKGIISRLKELDDGNNS